MCKHYRKKLWIYCQRFSNYADLSCTDEEVITLYLFGIIDERTKINQIYTDANRHLRAWFPNWPSYTAYVQRLNQVADVFAPRLEIILAEQEVEDNGRVWLTDSFPVVLAKQGHRFQAKVAPKLANAGLLCEQKIVLLWCSGARGCKASGWDFTTSGVGWSYRCK
ncbi:transposase ISSru4 [Thioploca ingrica]|uniref:Transposase ISSru4 n=1 Tax=Thioploca ingrica TaxID=40754 RepID=A0A090AH03_9GAMM|nr:transposase ISSru4 [Thioploca ingrica]